MLRILDRAREFHAVAFTDEPRTVEQLLHRYRLHDDGSIAVAYAPLDYVNSDARVVLLGITPGFHQTQLAFQTARELGGPFNEEVGREIKRRAAFAGSMRSNLIAMLDSLGIAERLGVVSASALFAERMDLLHSTSALRYPVFKNGKNYSGYGPKPTEHPALSLMIEQILVPELRSIPGALIVPLGGAVQAVLESLAARNVLSKECWLHGFPHPSGANGHRARIFSKNRARLVEDVDRWFSRLPRGDGARR